MSDNWERRSELRGLGKAAFLISGLSKKKKFPGDETISQTALSE